jgi:hypothetical protein
VAANDYCALKGQFPLPSFPTHGIFLRIDAHMQPGSYLSLLDWKDKLYYTSMDMPFYRYSHEPAISDQHNNHQRADNKYLHGS